MHFVSPVVELLVTAYFKKTHCCTTMLLWYVYVTKCNANYVRRVCSISCIEGMFKLR
jgi:hypothetical protein